MNKNSKIVIIAIVVIALIALAVIGFNSKTNSGVNASSTKVAFINNGTTWFHFDAVIENMTLKNGTVQNYYVQGYMKPGGNVTMDLSSLAGYGNQALPAGTTIRLMAWKGLFNQTIKTNTSDLNLLMQGWSKYLNPTSNDTQYNVTVQNLPVNQLPTNITNNTLIISTDPSTIQESNGTNESAMEPVFEEEVFTVDANGKVTMTYITPATLCNIVA
jgi:Tfp pilus assembly protein PilV